MKQASVSDISIPFPLVVRESNLKMQARKKFGEAFKVAQAQSVINGISEITLDEINDMIAEIRRNDVVK